MKGFTKTQENIMLFGFSTVGTCQSLHAYFTLVKYNVSYQKFWYSLQALVRKGYVLKDENGKYTFKNKKWNDRVNKELEKDCTFQDLGYGVNQEWRDR